MQIYEKLILHVQMAGEMDYDFPFPRDSDQTFFYNKLSKQITCFAFKIKCYCK